MTHLLKNKNLEIHINHPDENYRQPRFDWTGKIVGVRYKGLEFASVERLDTEDLSTLGRGFYNEFGIDSALGFDETEIGGWFHKIGVGLLKKNDPHYSFQNQFEIRPAKFTVSKDKKGIAITCVPEATNGYAYEFTKEIILLENKFTVGYCLKNTGEKEIITDEYCHNFIALDKAEIGSDYILKFPFQIEPQHFSEFVNPEDTVAFEGNELTFNGSPNDPFFFSNLSNEKQVDAGWELIHRKSKIGLRETGDFQTNKVNLWGWTHVISPELFHHISIKPNETTRWTRTYSMFRVK